MSENPILKWLQSDQTLCNIINQIDAGGNSFEEQALASFHQLAEHYDLPKYPGTFTDKHYSFFEQLGINEPRSVFEEATILKYLDPDDDPRGLVMVALYGVKNGLFTDINECAKKHFGPNKIPKEYTVCLVGDGYAGQLHFLQAGESWFELGARSAIKVITVS